MYFRCLHKSGGALTYTPAKCVRIIECCCRLHNKAIDEKVPAPATSNISLYSENYQISCDNSRASNIRDMIIRRF